MSSNRRRVVTRTPRVGDRVRLADGHEATVRRIAPLTVTCDHWHRTPGGQRFRRFTVHPLHVEVIE